MFKLTKTSILKSLSVVVAFTALLLSAVSCDNFLQGSALKDDVNELILDVNAPKVSVFITADGQGNVSPSGSQSFKIERDHKLIEYSEDKENKYCFLYWVVKNGTGKNAELLKKDVDYTIEDEYSPSTRITILKYTEGMTIMPVCAERIAVQSYSPTQSNNGVNRDRSISVIFTKEPDVNSFYFSHEEVAGEYIYEEIEIESNENIPETPEDNPSPEDDNSSPEDNEPSSEDNEPSPEDNEPSSEDNEPSPENNEPSPENNEPAPEQIVPLSSSALYADETGGTLKKVIAYYIDEFGNRVFKNISIKDSDGNDLSEYFNPPVLEGKLLTLSVAKQIPIDITGARFIEVTLGSSICDKDGISMSKDINWRYKIIEETDEKAFVTIKSQLDEDNRAMGEVTPEITGKDYSIGASINLGFTEYAGYQFVKWDYD